MPQVVVIGAGIAGTAAALFLARRQHTVTVIDRDDFTPSGDLDVDFFRHRPRVPQAVQPHGLLAPVRSVLRAEAPDVYAAMLNKGAREHHELDWFDPRPPAHPGDDDLVTLRARRIVLETALRDALAHQPHVELRLARAAIGLLTDVDGEVPHVAGVATRSGHLPADLVIDASGRRSPVAGWLAAAGCRAPVIEQQRTRIAYFCRWYRLPATGPTAPGRVADDGGAPFARSLVFPSDNRTLAVALALAADDPTRHALQHPEVYDALVRRFPASAAWLALQPQPLSEVYPMGGIDNRWSALVDNAGPVVTGLVGIGDAITHTNPTLGQGVAMALWAAQRVAATIALAAADPAAFAHDFHRWATTTLKPWFDRQVTVDTGIATSLTNTRRDTERSVEAALLPCSLDDPVVMRARAQVRHLVQLPDDALHTPKIRNRVTQWLENHPDWQPRHTGPTRAEWETLTTTLTANAP